MRNYLDELGSVSNISYESLGDGLGLLEIASFNLMQRLAVGLDTNTNDGILDNVYWHFSYMGPDSEQLSAGFRNNYAWACILCEGAGFYDTSLLYQIKPGTTSTYYDLLVTRENLPYSYDWLQSRPGDQPNLQASIGLTLQASANPDDDLDAGSTYPVHNHAGEELYFFLNPYNFTDNRTDNTNSYVAGAINADGLRPVFGSDMAPQVLNDGSRTFQEVGNADIAYNNPWGYHAMHPGKFAQISAWARLTNPEEGTFFPFNGVLAKTINNMDRNPQSRPMLVNYFRSIARLRSCVNNDSCVDMGHIPSKTPRQRSETVTYATNRLIEELVISNNIIGAYDPLGCSEFYMSNDVYWLEIVLANAISVAYDDTETGYDKVEDIIQASCANTPILICKRELLTNMCTVASVISEEDISEEDISDGIGDGIRGRIGGDIKD